MINKHVAVALIATAAIVTPVKAQSVVDTFRQFRNTLKQLGATHAGGPDATKQPPPVALSNAENTDDDRMVPASVIVDDISDTSLEKTSNVPRRVEGFDIRGLKLGMSPREVGRIGDRQHFRRRWNSLLLTSGSFEVEATNIANFQLNRRAVASSKVQLKAVEGFDPTGNELKCEFTLGPGGPKLSDVTYTAKLNGMTKQEAVAALTARLGTPTGEVLAISWDNSKGPLDNSSPRLTAVIDGGSMTLFLRQSVDYGLAARKRLRARAQEIAAAHGDGVQF